MYMYEVILGDHLCRGLVNSLLASSQSFTIVVNIDRNPGKPIYLPQDKVTIISNLFHKSSPPFDL